MLVCSYNPAYRSTLKDLKPSFRQRFVTLAMAYLPPDREADVLVAETGIDDSRRGAAWCAARRPSASADEVLHLEPPSTRTLVTAAHLVASGVGETEAAEVCILGPLSSDGTVTGAFEKLRPRACCPPTTNRQLTHPRKDHVMIQQDREKRRALVMLQVVIYGYLLLMFLIQLRLWSQRGW